MCGDKERKKGQSSQVNTRESRVEGACHQNIFLETKDERGTNKNHVIEQQDDVDDDDDQPGLLALVMG